MKDKITRKLEKTKRRQIKLQNKKRKHIRRTKKSTVSQSQTISTKPVKPNLLIATDSYLPRWDGIAKFLSDLLPDLTTCFSVTVIAPEFPGKSSNIPGVKTILMPMRTLVYGDYQIPRFKKALAKKAVREADLVWTHTIGPIGQGVLTIAKAKKKKIISYIHSVEWELFGRSLGQPLLYFPVASFTRRIIRKIYAKADILMFPSHSTMHLFSWYKFKAEKVLAPLGVDVKKYIPPKSKKEAKVKIGLQAEDNVIGYCGRIAHEKDIRTLIRAYLRIRDFYDAVKLVLVGPGIPDLMKKFDKIKGVTVVGPKNNVVPYYQAMDIYVLPSLTETTSLSTLEAMSCGTAVCSTPVGEVAYYIKNRKNGYIFSKGNSFELSHFFKLLLEDAQLRIKFGSQARKTIVDNYDWKKASKNIISQLQKEVPK